MSLFECASGSSCWKEQPLGGRMKIWRERMNRINSCIWGKQKSFEETADSCILVQENANDVVSSKIFNFDSSPPQFFWLTLTSSSWTLHLSGKAAKSFIWPACNDFVWMKCNQQESNCWKDTDAPDHGGQNKEKLTHHCVVFLASGLLHKKLAKHVCNDSTGVSWVWNTVSL